MTREHLRFVTSSQAAERAGEAEAALEFHRGVPMFVRGRHVTILAQLASLSGEMTPWLWARWAAYQCTRSEDRGTTSGEIHRAALDYVVRMFYSDRIQDAYLHGGDPIKVLAKVGGESWLYQQLCTHELGGLKTYLDDLATGRMLDNGDLPRSWVGARMGGYQVQRHGEGSLVVLDLDTGHERTLIDLGAADRAGVGGWLLGRVVASGTTPELMFDTRPMEVDELTARSAATSSTRGGWVSAVKSALVQERLPRELFESEDLELASDVPALSLLEAGTPLAALAGTLTSLGRGRDEIGRSAYRILRRVADGSIGSDVGAPYVAAAVLNPHGYAEALRVLAGTGEVEVWARWASLVPEPARARLLHLAGLAAAA